MCLMVGKEDPLGGSPNTDSDQTSLLGRGDLAREDVEGTMGTGYAKKVLVGLGRLGSALRRRNSV